MRVLITGGAGFIGSHVVEACLAAGHEPFVIDNLSAGLRAQVPPGVPFFQADIRDAVKLARVFDEVHPEAVSHHAAQPSVGCSMRDAALDADVNVVGLVRVLEQSARRGVSRFVFASSGGCLYGDVDGPVDEQAAVRPICPSGLSKWAGEQYVTHFARTCGWRASILRYSNVYGSRQSAESDGGVVAIVCRALLSGRPPVIFGDGRAVRDFIFVEDVARANVLALTATSGPCDILNIGTGRPTSIVALVERLRETIQLDRPRLGLPAAIHAAARPGDLPASLVDVPAAHRVLHWQPRTTLAAGLRPTVAWFANVVPQ